MGPIPVPDSWVVMENGSGPESTEPWTPVHCLKSTVLTRTLSSASQCVALVRRDHPDANAAEYSNVGGEWCFAVFEA